MHEPSTGLHVCVVLHAGQPRGKQAVMERGLVNGIVMEGDYLVNGTVMERGLLVVNT